MPARGRDPRRAPGGMRAAAPALLAALCAARGGAAAANGTRRPVVLMHGLLAGSEAMSHAQKWIEADFPGIHIHNVEIGNGKDDSLLMNINKQVRELAASVRSDPALSRGFNLIGHSQGGLLARAYVERFNDPPVYNLVSWAGPNDGVFGVPDFNGICPPALCPWINKIMSNISEDWSILQDVISFATYWRDPLHLDDYARSSIFLADINNERPEGPNATYRDNMLRLNAFGMEYSTTDLIVVPRTSPWFKFYGPGQASKLQPLEESDQYTKDLIGLRTLDQQGRLKFWSTDCGHQDIPRDKCNASYVQNTRELLDNYLD